MSIDRRMDKEDVVYINNVILLSHKKEWNKAICSNMEGPGAYHTKWSKPDSKRDIPYHITYMWNSFSNEWYKWTYLQNRNRPTDTENKLMVTKGEKVGWGGIN